MTSTRILSGRKDFQRIAAGGFATQSRDLVSSIKCPLEISPIKELAVYIIAFDLGGVLF